MCPYGGSTVRKVKNKVQHNIAISELPSRKCNGISAFIFLYRGQVRLGLATTLQLACKTLVLRKEDMMSSGYSGSSVTSQTVREVIFL